LSETLNTHLDRLTEEEEQGLVDSLLRQSRKLMRLSSVLLDLTQLEGGSARMEVESLSLADIVDDVLTITVVPDGVALHREVDVQALVVADEVRVQEIIENLLTNAFRYGGSRVRIRTRAGDGSWSLIVEDDGLGLTEDLVQRVFEPVVRGASPAPGSSGLGLSIARAIARAMGGDLGYETCDRGARFVLTLPAALHALRPA
jgi:two-component system sensor histidine kinase MtrB